MKLFKVSAIGKRTISGTYIEKNAKCLLLGSPILIGICWIFVAKQAWHEILPLLAETKS